MISKELQTRNCRPETLTLFLQETKMGTSLVSIRSLSPCNIVTGKVKMSSVQVIQTFNQKYGENCDISGKYCF